MIAAAAVCFALAQATATDSTGAADPAYARDGRLALSLRGDLWVRLPGPPVRWIQVTSGPASDREPAWWPDGSALVFASDRSGDFRLWRVTVGPNGPTAEPARVTDSSAWEGEPTVSRGGDLVFVRGRGSLARLILRTAAGVERPLTPGRDGAERWPAYAPDGQRIAYVTLGARGGAVRLRWLERDSTIVVVRDREAERPTWSPNGDRLVFAVRRGAPGVWVTPLDGAYTNLVSLSPAAASWSPDGRNLALVTLPPAEPSYNGDPDRSGDRDLAETYPGTGSLALVPAPPPPDAGRTGVPLAPIDRPAANAAGFDRLWSRTASLYFSGPADTARRARWDSLRAVYRPRALGAKDDRQLQSVLHQLWRERPPLRQPAAGRAAVSSAHPVATQAGLDILKAGGNVVDAAVAVSFALGVVEPDASGIGGYGQMLVQLSSFAAAASSPALLEFMTRVPEDAGLSNTELTSRGGYPSDGPALANVPGTVAGMYLSWQKYGGHRLAWADLVAPAIHAAEEGFPVSDGLATTLRVEREHFLKYQGSRALFFPNGEPLRAGDILKNPDLGRTLRAIADSGPPAFYRGAIARRMVEDLRGQGNAMRLTDLARYFAAEREPVSGTYRGYTVFSSAPPSAGGATLVSQLNLLERFARPQAYAEDAATLHAMIEAWKLVPSGRGRIADPGLWPVQLDAYVSKDSAGARWRCYDPARALTPLDTRGDTLRCGQARTKLSPDGPARAAEALELQQPPQERACSGELEHCHQAGTTAFVVADADGNVVAVTQTLGTWGGNFYVTPGLGFLYNDKLTSYGDDPAEYGVRLPNARHGSSLAPTLVFRGSGAQRRPVLAVGAAGNAWITSAVYAVVTGMLDQQLDPQHAIEQPRFLLGQRRNAGASVYTVAMESGVAPDVLRQLERLGDEVEIISLPGELRMGYGAAVWLGEIGVVAAADPRRSGTAGAIGCRKNEARNCRLDTYQNP